VAAAFVLAIVLMLAFGLLTVDLADGGHTPGPPEGFGHH
jgi:hypothetical protein